MKKFALLFMSFLVFGWQPQAGTSRQGAALPKAEVRPEDKCSVEGRVLNGKTGDPLNKAQVILYGQGRDSSPAAAITDASGRFLMQNIDPGTYRISVSRNGFARAEMERNIPGQPSNTLTLSPGQKLKDLTYKLQPAAVISGRVADEDGEPLAGAQVAALMYRYVRGKRQLAPAMTASTDDLGNFRLYGLAPGKYYVKASYWDRGPGGMMMAGPLQNAADAVEVHAPLYYPGVLDASQAEALSVTEGEERRAVDFRMVRSRTVRVRGRVTGAGTFTSQRAPTVLMAQRGSAFMAERPSYSRVLPNGNFELRGVLPGSYTVTAFFESEGTRLTARRDLEVADSNIDGLELALTGGAELSGSVRVENAADTKPKLDPIRVMLQAGEDFLPYGFSNARVNADGTFTAKDLGDGDYKIRVFGLPERHYVSSIRAGTADVTETGIRVAQGSAPGPLVVVIRGDAGSMDGRVVDSEKKPKSGARVVVIGKALRDGASVSGSDQNGAFRITSVPPGDYEVYAFESIEPGAWDDPDSVAPFKDKAAKVTVQPNANQNIEVELIPAGGR